ncbi:MAG: ABC transporter ATP-binding protein [Candidatus Hydrogenedentes bacterium]|nr:ABC transporter ATP-binding protein [Candidatus Hydrogenedentota bacterium]
MDSPDTLLKLTDIEKIYGSGDAATPVLSDIALEVNTGDSIAIVGPSGCGKSTLLNLIGLLDTPTSGSIHFNGAALDGFNEIERAAFRNRSIGFVFQLHHLLPQCTALENVLVPSLVNSDRSNAPERATHLLERVGLKDRMGSRPSQLSGGERQRVAVVRALINRPKLLLADEPTGALSEEGSASLTGLLLELSAEEKMALIVVTHANAVAQKMDTVLELRNGKLALQDGSR